MYFMFDRSNYRLFVLNRGWKRFSLHIMIFVYVCSTWGIVELQTRFDTWITRKEVNGVGLSHHSYLITLMAYLCSQLTPNFQIKYFIIDWGWKRDSLQLIIFVFVCSTWNIVELKTRFESWIKRNDVNGLSVFNISYLITLMAYVCSQRTPNLKSNILYCIGRPTDYLCYIGPGNMSLQILIFVYICSTWAIVQLKTRFE
jgi:hypothetical protein